MKILFVCTGNTCRSPMAELMMKKMAEEQGLDIEVDSAGIFAASGAPVTESATFELRERGINPSNNRSKRVSKALIESADLVLCMSDSHRRMLVESYPKEADKIKTLPEHVGESKDVMDPYGGDYYIYSQCADRIESLLEKLVDRIIKQN